MKNNKLKTGMLAALTIIVVALVVALVLVVVLRKTPPPTIIERGNMSPANVTVTSTTPRITEAMSSRRFGDTASCPTSSSTSRTPQMQREPRPASQVPVTKQGTFGKLARGAPQTAYTRPGPVAPQAAYSEDNPMVVSTPAGNAHRAASLRSIANQAAAEQERKDMLDRLSNQTSVQLNASNMRLPTTQLASVVNSPPGTALAFGTVTAVKATSVVDSFADTSMLQSIDPKGHAELEQAMTLTAVPATWHMDRATAEARKNKELLKTMMLQGAIDPSIEDIMNASSPYVGTAEQARRAMSAQREMERSIILPPPLRFLYQGPLDRPAVVAPTMSPLIGESGPITAGQDYMLTTMACANQGKPMTAEPY